MNLDKIYDDLTSLHAEYLETLAKSTNSEYLRYNHNMCEWYTELSVELFNALGIKGGTPEELKGQLSAIGAKPLTAEQKQKIAAVRRHPIYKKVMGERALAMKPQLEQILETKITEEKAEVDLEYGKQRQFKDRKTLDSELIENTCKLDRLLDCGKITEMQAEQYSTALAAIYDYYASLSKGEQVIYKKRSDKEYAAIEEQAELNGITPEEQLRKDNEDSLYRFKEVAEFEKVPQSHGRTL